MGRRNTCGEILHDRRTPSSRRLGRGRWSARLIRAGALPILMFLPSMPNEVSVHAGNIPHLACFTAGIFVSDHGLDGNACTLRAGPVAADLALPALLTCLGNSPARGRRTRCLGHIRVGSGRGMCAVSTVCRCRLSAYIRGRHVTPLHRGTNCNTKQPLNQLIGGLVFFFSFPKENTPA